MRYASGGYAVGLPGFGMVWVWRLVLRRQLSRLDQLLLFRFCFGPGRIRVLMFLCSGLWLLVAEEGTDNKPNIIHDGTKLYQPKTKLGEEERADHSNENVRTSSIAVAKPPNR